MSKISSNQNHEFISMIDKTKTPVFNMNLGEKFNEISQKAITEIITENKENNSVIIKSSNRDSSFNEDNEEFDDIPLCEFLPKNKKYEDKIPKLDIPDSSIPVIHEPHKQEEKKEKPKVSFSNIFKKKEAHFCENKIIEQPEPLNDKKTSKDSFDEDHEEFDDIPICEYQNKNNQYGNKIPKLELPNSNIGETGHASQNLPKIQEIKDTNNNVKSEEKKEVFVNKFKNIFNKKITKSNVSKFIIGIAPAIEVVGFRQKLKAIDCLGRMISDFGLNVAFVTGKLTKYSLKKITSIPTLLTNKTAKKDYPGNTKVRCQKATTLLELSCLILLRLFPYVR